MECTLSSNAAAHCSGSTVEHGAAGHDARAVEQHVHLARRLRERGDGGRVAHVEHVALAARDILQRIAIDVGGDDSRARAREAFRAGAADSRARRGDYRDLARQSLRFHKLLVLFRSKSVRALWS